MCGSLRVTKNQMRDFVLGKNIKSSSSSVGSGSNQVQLSTAADATNDNISQDTGNKKRAIEIDDYDEAKCPSKVAKAEETEHHNIIEPIAPDKNYLIINNAESKRYIIYMAVRESDPKFSEGLSKCNAACSDPQVQSCLQFDGTRHITMFDGYLTNEQARNLSYRYNRFENGTLNPTKLKIEGWMPWDAGCYLKISPRGEKMLEAMLGKIDGFPDSIKQSLQTSKLAKNGKVKFPCNHLSLYRSRPNMDRSKMKRSFGVIRKALTSHDWGFVEIASIRIKAMGEPYSDCKVIAGI